jgi:hypothetical protein
MTQDLKQVNKLFTIQEELRDKGAMLGMEMEFNINTRRR